MVSNVDSELVQLLCVPLAEACLGRALESRLLVYALFFWNTARQVVVRQIIAREVAFKALKLNVISQRALASIMWEQWKMTPPKDYEAFLTRHYICYILTFSFQAQEP